MKNAIRDFVKFQQENKEVTGEALLSKFFTECEHLDIPTWSYDDIRHRIKENGITLTENEIKEVAGYLECYHDANEGTSWISIDTCVDIIISDR